MGKRTPALSRRILGLVNWPSTVRHTFLSQYIKHVFQSHVICEPGIRASTSGIWINVTVLSQQFHPIHGSASKPKLLREAKTVESDNVEAKDTEDKIASDGKAPAIEVDGVSAVISEVGADTKPLSDLAQHTESSVLDAKIKPTLREIYSLNGHPLVRRPVLNFGNVQLENALGSIDSRIKIMMDGTDPERKKKELREGHFYFKPLSEGSPKSLLEANECVDNPLNALQIYSNKPIHLRINIVDNPVVDAQILSEYIARSLKENDRALPKIFKQLLTSIGAKI